MRYPKGRNNQHNRLYDSSRWRKARKQFLADHPLCVMCLQHGLIVPATIVDHIQPHNNDLQLFYDSANFQSLCATCHSGIKRIQDNHGYSQSCDSSGIPLDINHPWSK